MRRLLLPLVAVALAAALFATRSHWLPQPAGQLGYLGYVEGQTVLVAATQAGRLTAVSAEKGGTVAAGDRLFTLDPAQAEAEVARATAALETARATHANLLSGKREEELAVIASQTAQAEASLALAQKELQRAQTLASTGTAAQSRLDQAQEQVKFYASRLAELTASDQVARLPARPDEIAAAAARVGEAEAQLAAARARLADLAPAAPAAAEVEDVFFQPGEWVAAGQPVVSLQRPEDVTLRFFVPEAVLAKAQPGTPVRFRCDGCAGEGRASIVSVAREPEFTPPVIYSEGARAKLVYLVEARPEGAGPSLRPGLPIAVEPLQ